MNPQLPPLTIGGIVQKESDDLVILGVTFVPKLTFEKHLRLVSRAASQRLGILRKSCECSMIDHLFRDASGVLSRPFWSTVLRVVLLSIHTLNYWTVQSGGPVPNWGCV